MVQRSLRDLMRSGPQRQQTLRRGDVIFLRLPQDISSSAHVTNYKPRPFVVFEETVSFPVDDRGFSQRPVSLLGVGCTSQGNLVKERPSIVVQIPGEPIVTYAWFDTLRTEIIPATTKFEVAHRLSDHQIALSRTMFDRILRQESRFDRFVSNSKFAPGQIWQMRTATEIREGFIILRRGSFTLDDDPSREPAQVPYLVALFRGAGQLTTLHGVGWDDVKITALPQTAFDEREGVLGALGINTVDIFLNNLRRKVGIDALPTGEAGISNSRFAIMAMFLLRRPSLSLI
jgi:hypothetical protein